MRNHLLVVVAVVLPMSTLNARTLDSVGYCLSEGFFENEPSVGSLSLGGPSDQVRGSVAGAVEPTLFPGPFADLTVRDSTLIADSHPYGSPILSEFDEFPAVCE